MEIDFWLEKWKNGETRWHNSAACEDLVAYWSELDIPKGARVLVPLCGKSLDLVWLRDQGYSVLGVELSQQATEAFWQENDEPFSVSTEGDFERYKGKGIEILQGDFFKLRGEIIGDFEAVYDRAALIALPPELRDKYTATLESLSPAWTQLLVVVEYEPSEPDTPPFSLEESYIREVCYPECAVTLLGLRTVDGTNGPLNWKSYSVIRDSKKV